MNTDERERELLNRLSAARNAFLAAGSSNREIRNEFEFALRQFADLVLQRPMPIMEVPSDRDRPAQTQAAAAGTATSIRS